jgi:SAM-dependent methyltransferase
MNAERKIVIVMPFSRTQRMHDLRKLIQEAARRIDRKASIIEAQTGGRKTIIQTILDDIFTADLVCVVLEQNNPNVMFEAGYAQALGRRILFLAPEAENSETPFDVRGFRQHTYKDMGEPDLERIASAMREALDVPEGLVTHIAQLTRNVDLADGRASPELFKKILDELLRGTVKRSEDWGNKITFHGRDEIIKWGGFNVQHARQRAFLTFYAPSSDAWDEDQDPITEDNYLELLAARATSELDVTRVYILSHDSDADLSNKGLRRQVARDARNGIKTYCILEEKLSNIARSNSALSPLDLRDMGIWDDSTLALVRYHEVNGKSEPAVMEVFGGGEKLDSAQASRSEILAGSSSWTGIPAEKSLLKESALNESLWAEQSCKGSVVGDDCRWYHGAWQKLRLCGVVSTPSWHQSFYRSSFGGFVRPRAADGTPTRVLISGLADYGMLYQLLCSCTLRELNSCHFTVIDQCEVPLRMVSWLDRKLATDAIALSINFKIVHGDVLQAETLGEDQFDCVVSDAFLSRFADREQKLAVLSRWESLLRPGGVVLTTVRVRNGRPSVLVEDVERFVKRVADHGADDETQRAARTYAVNMSSYPMGRDDWEALFGGPAWEAKRLEPAQVPGELERSNYLRIMARRR